MKSGFFDKLIKRVNRLEPGEVQHFLAELLREKGLLEKVFQALQEGVILLDPEGHVTYVNAAACHLFGFQADQIIGKQLAEGVRGVDWGELRKPGTVVSRDLEVFYPENRYLNFYITSIDDTVDTGFVMLIRDVTQSRKLTEEKIESERINAFTLLAAGVAHELGNPLNSLTIHLQLMERALKKMGKGGDKLQKHLDVSIGEIQRLDFIINQFLAAIRPTQPQLQRVNVNELLQDAARFLKPELEQNKVKLKLELRADVPQMPLDANQMKQAFYNLIRNAGQAMGESGGTLTVSTTFNDFEVIVSFQDSGKGITRENMGNLFQPFFTTRKTGTGLGLLIVRRIVREHGGEIDIESRQGQGTKVSLFLPLVEKRMRLLGEGSEMTKSE
ncbi:MAG: ntrB [Verrucomicrobiaceae bacterium]|nr:ntrB [Verrucomicrobiaceae bacterium]